VDFNSIAGETNSNGFGLMVGSGFSGAYPPGLPTIQLLYNTPSQYTLMMPQQFYGSFGAWAPPPFTNQPFFYQDTKRAYFVTETFASATVTLVDSTLENQIYARTMFNQVPPVRDVATVFPSASRSALRNALVAAGPSSSTALASLADHAVAGSARITAPLTDGGADATPALSQVLFSTFFHPFTCALIKALNQYGLPTLLAPGNQALTNDSGVILGCVLSPHWRSATPNMSPGLLVAQGQLYEATTAPDPNLGPAPYNAGSYLYFNSQTKFYYSQTATPSTPGDAFLGTVEVGGLFLGVFLATGSTTFEQNYQPNSSYIDPATYPRENFDFSPSGSYSIYNWELFFHIPLLIATRLSQNQRFADAQKWFHFIFNPTTSSTDSIPQRYWKFLPFYECSPWDQVQGQIQNLFYPASNGSTAQPNLCGQGIADQIAVWMSSPFDPFAIGRMRSVAFRMKVVMAYLDNLLAWGDNLFRQNTRESINEATQIYILAKDILGPRPIQIPQRGTAADYSYNDLVTLYGVDDFSNALVQMENDFPYLSVSAAQANTGLGAALSMSSVVPYFCFPSNDNLLTYWNAVDDRLYKIRHCMNIQGVVEQLPLFAPPISPALLVAAQAAGVDLSSVLSNTDASTSLYRFRFMAQKALELCAEVRAFGAALLAALEKQDAEELSLLRATQETGLLQSMQNMKQAAVQEAQSNVAALQAGLQLASDRQAYYSNLHNAWSTQEPSSQPTSQESQQLSSLGAADSRQGTASTILQEVAVFSILPQSSVGLAGAGGSPYVNLSWGMEQLTAEANAFAAKNQADAGDDSFQASMSGLQAEWGRRDAQWVFEAAQASDEMAQVQAQIAAANLRVTIAQDDLANLNTQIANAQAVEDYLRSKYTNTQLYSWMVDQTSTVYFQCYQMAYDLAVRAEATFRFERGLASSNYIQFGYWDSLKKGLLAGERLYADLKRMEIDYFETDVREYEITKSVSLVLFDPWALITLKETGQCTVSLPEALFNMDYPSHYFRRLTTVSLSIPSVTGAYTSVNCTLTLVNSKIRVDNVAGSVQDYASAAHFINNYAATQAIATSTAQNDSGLFEVNFRDERYLPFEGAGVISTWQIDMPPDCNAFDFASITDVILNLRYTAREGGERLRDVARKAAVMPARPQQSFSGSTVSFPNQSGLQRLFSFRHEFPTEWYKFLHPADTSTSQSMQIALDNSRFPFTYRGKKIQITQAELVLLFANAQFQADYASGGSNSQLVLSLGPGGGGNSSSIALASNAAFLNGAAYGKVSQVSQPNPPGPGLPASWVLAADQAAVAKLDPRLQTQVTSGGSTYTHLNAAAISDLLLLCQFSAAQ
jgi:hypothetical protein